MPAQAKIVVLRKLKKLAPDFHRHIAVAQAQGKMLAPGDSVLVYEVAETVPAGPVLVTKHTQFNFI
ncbi:MAG: hypothetical protein D9V47_12910 [Clostridia bacterium]|nr:MAG: hypothetical protein D9V47_12910 [Clostridia bacterium]